MLSIIHAKSDHPLKEGLRLTSLNFIYILASAGIFIGLILFVPLTILAMPIFILSGVGYFYFWIQFSQSFSCLSSKWTHLKMLVVGFIGVVPNLLLMFSFRYLTNQDPNSCGAGDIVGYIIFLISALVMPIVSLLSIIKNR